MTPATASSTAGSCMAPAISTHDVQLAAQLLGQHALGHRLTKRHKGKLATSGEQQACGELVCVVFENANALQESARAWRCWSQLRACICQHAPCTRKQTNRRTHLRACSSVHPSHPAHYPHISNPLDPPPRQPSHPPARSVAIWGTPNMAPAAIITPSLPASSSTMEETTSCHSWMKRPTLICTPQCTQEQKRATEV